jgi:hypothetical protein
MSAFFALDKLSRALTLGRFTLAFPNGDIDCQSIERGLDDQDHVFGGCGICCSGISGAIERTGAIWPLAKDFRLPADAGAQRGVWATKRTACAWDRSGNGVPLGTGGDRLSPNPGQASSPKTLLHAQATFGL